MNQLRDTVWQRQGISWVWDEEARNQVCSAPEIWSLRRWLSHRGNWPDLLPSNNGDTLVVAGLEGSLDLLTPQDGEVWLGETIKDAILSFQNFYEGDAALIFWLPGGQNRIRINSATDVVNWHCALPYREETLDFGRILWGEAREYPKEILLREGGSPIGLFHRRIT